jgi:hypothetical protein
MLPELAAIVVAPGANPVASPPELMLAIFGAVELHITESVMILLLPSLNVPKAVNCMVLPTVSAELTGATAIDIKEGSTSTERDVVPLTPPEVAVIFVVPGTRAVARPTVVMVAMSVAEELHVADGRLCVLPSRKVPVAVNCMVAATAIEGFAGVTAIDINWFAEEPAMPEHANMETAAAIPTKRKKTGIA